MVYNGYYKVMSNISKMRQLPTPVQGWPKAQPSLNQRVPPSTNRCIILTWSAVFVVAKWCNIVTSTFEWHTCWLKQPKRTSLNFKVTNWGCSTLIRAHHGTRHVVNGLSSSYSWKNSWLLKEPTSIIIPFMDVFPIYWRVVIHHKWI